MRKKNKPSEPAQHILTWSMNCHRALFTFHANCHIALAPADYDPSDPARYLEGKRQVQYARPNRYHIVSEFQFNFQTKGAFVPKMWRVACNGQEEVDDSLVLALDSPTVSHQTRQAWRAPQCIAEASSAEMTAPLLCGSLLYKFFGGQSYLRALVDKAKAPILLLQPQIRDDQECHVISFHARDAVYSQVEVAISTHDGLVRYLQYDPQHYTRQMMRQLRSEWQSGRLEGVQGELGEFKVKMGDLLALMEMTPPALPLITETYSQILVNEPVGAEVFDAPPSRIEAPAV